MEIDFEALTERFRSVRRFTEDLAGTLSAEDCALQSMDDVSPTKWHLAHTTWFFETFILAEQPNYQVFDETYAYLFNSYYNTVGKQFPRSQRGLLSRPGLAKVLAYRSYVDELMEELLTSKDKLNHSLAKIVEIGLHHEQQHQELILTDIKHVLSLNPLRPTYRDGTFPASQESAASDWLEYEEGIYSIGHEHTDFCFDNELPRHRVFLESFQLCDQLVNCGQYIQFIEDGAYQRPEPWLSLGWQFVCEHEWNAPLYWYQQGGRWYEFTLAGPREICPESPMCHVSYFEADAFARWSGARLPTESEWEVASQQLPTTGSFVDTLWGDGNAIHPGCGISSVTRPARIFGDVWEWTASPYVPYPGYAPPRGALGEYNGKFMCNQYVLRGGSCATHSSHIRNTYRNFFPPDARWQWMGIRLSR